MSLIYACPILESCYFLGRKGGPTRPNLEQKPAHPLSDRVFGLAIRILEKENIPSSRYYKKIQLLLETLRGAATTKTISSLVKLRLRVKNHDAMMIDAATPLNCSRVFYGIPKESNIYFCLGPQINEPLLPWFVAYQLSHILDDTYVKLHVNTILTTLVVAVITTQICQWSLLPSLGAMLIVRYVVADMIIKNAKLEAHQFAYKHTTKDEYKKADRFLRSLVDTPTRLSQLPY